MNDRLEIASRLMAYCYGCAENALRDADALIAEEARTRKPEAVEDDISDVRVLVEVKGNTRLVPVDVAEELSKLRVVGNKLYAALATSCSWDKGVAFVAGESALSAARELGLGGGK